MSLAEASRIRFLTSPNTLPSACRRAGIGLGQTLFWNGNVFIKKADRGFGQLSSAYCYCPPFRVGAQFQAILCGNLFGPMGVFATRLFVLQDYVGFTHANNKVILFFFLSQANKISLARLNLAKDGKIFLVEIKQFLVYFNDKSQFVVTFLADYLRDRLLARAG